MNKETAKEMFLFLDEHGEHRLVDEYKGKVSDSEISSIINAWATSIEPLDIIIEHYYLYLDKLK